MTLGSSPFFSIRYDLAIEHFVLVGESHLGVSAIYDHTFTRLNHRKETFVVKLKFIIVQKKIYGKPFLLSAPTILSVIIETAEKN